MTTLPLIRHVGLYDVFAYREGRPLDVAEFLLDTYRLAAELPERGYMLNLCADRYHFAVGYAAALLRRQISLLPPNHTASLLQHLERQYPTVYCLTDGALQQPFLDTVFYPRAAAPDAMAQSVPAIPADQLAAIVFTSGSTGRPVPHEKSWGSLVQSARVAAERLEVLTHPGLVILGTVPPQHMYGLESTLLIAMHNGLALEAGRPFYPADICARLDALPRPRCLVTTPIHLRTVLAETPHLPPLDVLVCATAPLAPQTAVEAEARFGAPLFEIYGCTEAGQVATRRTVDTVRWQVFRHLTLRQDEAGTWVSGGHVEREILLHDVIELCGTESFLLHGRVEDMVNIAGKRTSLSSLNYHLNSIAGVRDGVFVMPEESDKAVTRPLAFVVAPGLSGEEVMQAMRQRVDEVFLPRPLIFVEALPRNSTGKLPRQALEQLILQYAQKVS